MTLPPAASADDLAHKHEQFSVGPARLTLMPAGQVASLDPYMAQMVTYRNSGLSLNHIIGCPLNCGYCVRHFWGDFEHKTPHLLCDTREAIRLLLGHEAFRPSVTPIQLFNKATDPFLPAVKPHLFHVLQELDDRSLDNLVLVITRFTVTAEDMAILERLRAQAPDQGSALLAADRTRLERPARNHAPRPGRRQERRRNRVHRLLP